MTSPFGNGLHGDSVDSSDELNHHRCVLRLSLSGRLLLLVQNNEDEDGDYDADKPRTDDEECKGSEACGGDRHGG